jgi:uncharacterized membrane protein
MRTINDHPCALRPAGLSSLAKPNPKARRVLEAAMDVLGFATLVAGGFTACAEFGSYAFVHPVIRRLPSAHHIEVEQGLLRTFGRVMPVLMTITMVLGIANASTTSGQGGPRGWRWAAAAAWIAALTSTVIFNVPVNLATGRWDPQHPPQNWKQVRNRWEFFQGLRSWLLLAGFVLASAGFAIG